MENCKIITDTKSRRSFLKETGIVIAGSALAYHTGLSASLATPKKDTLKIGLIGCGGRGAGAASDAIAADPNVVLTAMGDIFEDRLECAFSNIIEINPRQVKVDKQIKFIGFDAYSKVIASGVDVVLLATPPAFRTLHLTAAIDAGKHVFCEK